MSELDAGPGMKRGCRCLTCSLTTFDDFHTLQVLREKAEQRNPDEFYQEMQREQMHGANREAG